MLAGCGARWGAVACRERCRRGPGGGHSQTFRHRRGGLGSSDGVGVGECSILPDMEGFGDLVTGFMANAIEKEHILVKGRISPMYRRVPP